MILRGVDGCPAGWIAASLDLETGKVTGEVFKHDETALLLRDPHVAVTAIDIPIGLPSRDRPRIVDREAQRLLKQRRSSVFLTPPRAVLGVKDYAAACEIARAEHEKAMSKQAFAILEKIEAVDKVLRENPELQARVFEVHPELCFYSWAEEKPMRHPKRTGFGFMERIKLVGTVFDGVAEEIREKFQRKAVHDDDILDALAALWTARRIHAGTAVKLPQGREQLDACGLPMRMLA
jgi:predicted RNase H-like nuclease